MNTTKPNIKELFEDIKTWCDLKHAIRGEFPCPALESKAFCDLFLVQSSCSLYFGEKWDKELGGYLGRSVRVCILDGWITCRVFEPSGLVLKFGFEA